MTNTELFMKFSESFIKKQKEWRRVFNDKLKVDEWSNPRIRKIRNNSSLYTIKEKFIYATLILFPTNEVKFNMLVFLLHDDENEKEIIDKILSIYNPYEAGKLLTSLKPSLQYTTITSDYIALKIMGLGGKDGLELIRRDYPDKKEMGDLYFFNKLFQGIEKKKFPQLFEYTNKDKLFLEDLLCEFHMFYRLFLPGYDDKTPEEVIDLIDNNQIDYIVLSNYIPSDETYDDFQKQYILKIKLKEEK